ncbi:MAG: VCBS repeat-containing protein [Verrucomicrobiota bacterium]
MKTNMLKQKLTVALFIGGSCMATADDLQRLQYNHPGLAVDLGVGLWAWPLPMDWDEDGDMDLIVSCPDKPYNGIYFFENSTGDKMPVFKRPVRLGPALKNIWLSYVDGEAHVMTPGHEWSDFLGKGFETSEKIYKTNLTKGKLRAKQWVKADYDGDGALDIIVGEGFWGEYGWDDAYDETGTWTNGPLRGWLYLLRNKGTNDQPEYLEPRKIKAGGKVIDVFGMPSPNLADFDGDGDLDILCGEFLDGFTYFQNVGTRKEPEYAEGRRLKRDGRDLAMHVQMITPVAVDWDKDGDIDLVVGDEDGRVAFVEHTGEYGKAGVPRFHHPVYFQQEAGDMKFGALATPVGVDWDEDGDDDIIAGNTAGNIAFFENLDGQYPPKWAAPVLLEAGGAPIHIQAGPNGSIQGPCEANWGYTTQTVADWDHDGRLDIVVNSIWGRVIWYRNSGEKGAPRLEEARPVEVEWTTNPPKPAWNWWDPNGKNLVTQWRTTPVVIDWNRDGLNDLVMLDHEGYLALFEREKRGEAVVLLAGKRIFTDEQGAALQLNAGWAGKSGRRKLEIVDWDGDGDLDVLANSTNAELWRNEGSSGGKVVLKNVGNIGERNVSGHTSSPTTIDLNGDGKKELLVGAEDGRFYHLDPHAKR